MLFKVLAFVYCFQMANCLETGNRKSRVKNKHCFTEVENIDFSSIGVDQLAEMFYRKQGIKRVEGNRFLKPLFNSLTNVRESKPYTKCKIKDFETTINSILKKGPIYVESASIKAHNFTHTYDVEGDGNCFYYSLIKGSWDFFKKSNNNPMLNYVLSPQTDDVDCKFILQVIESLQPLVKKIYFEKEKFEDLSNIDLFIIIHYLKALIFYEVSIKNPSSYENFLSESKLVSATTKAIDNLCNIYEYAEDLEISILHKILNLDFTIVLAGKQHGLSVFKYIQDKDSDVPMISFLYNQNIKHYYYLIVGEPRIRKGLGPRRKRSRNKFSSF